MSGSIRSLEILSSGTHNASTGILTINEEDLDQVVEAFHSLRESNIVRPHLKLGHSDAQKWFGQKDGIPSLGWIESVWRQGTKLLADIANVPDSLLNLIKQGRYHNVSAELIWGRQVEFDGKSFSRVLSAVSLLGVEMPAVKDLAGLAEALFSTDLPDPCEVITLAEEIKMPAKDVPPEATYSQTQVDALVEAAVKKAVDEIEVKFAESTQDAATKLKVVTERAEQAEAEIKKLKLAAITSESESLVDQAIKDGKLLPKQRDFALSMLQASDAIVKFGDGEKSTKEVFAEFLEAQGKVIDLEEKGSGKHVKKDFSTPAEEVDHKAKALTAADAKLSYASAYDQVLAGDPDLQKRYAESMT
jgi:hypothetical protein